MADRDDSPPGNLPQRIVDTGEGNRIQVGNSNTHVNITLPSGASESDLPTVTGPDESRDAASATTKPPDVEVVMAGKGGGLQLGNSNLIVVARRAEEIELQARPYLSGESTPEALQEAGVLSVDADGDSQTGSTYPQAMVPPLPINELSRLQEIQQTKVKQIDPPLTYLNIDPDDPDLETQSEDLNDRVEEQMATPELLDDEAMVDVDGDSDIVQFHQIIGQYLTTAGPNCVTVDIEVDRNFLHEVYVAETRPESALPVRILSLVWTGPPDPTQRYMSSWRLTLSPYTNRLESEVLRQMTSGLFISLRNLASRVYGNYKAYLCEVFRGPLVFVFLHPDPQTASRMVEDRNTVKGLFRRMMVDLGSRDVEFTLEAIPSPEAVGVVQPHRTNGSRKDTAVEMEARLQSMESGYQQVQQDLSSARQERRELKTTLEHMVSLLTSSVLSPDSTQSTAHSIQKALENTDLSKKSVLLKTSKADQKSQHNNSVEKTDVHAVKDSQRNSMTSESSMAIGGEKRNIKAKPKRSTRSQKVFEEAERLLNSLNVASVGRSSTDREVKRLTESVAEALVDDDPPPPRAKSMDTLLCLDVSDSVGVAGIAEVKRIAHDFVDGIQEVAERHSLEENLALICMGGGARVAQQLTNDYTLVKDAIDSLEVGGRSPIFETLGVCVAALKGRGGVLSVGGAHNIRPRIIFITDGKATNDRQEIGPDVPSTDQNTKIQLIRLVKQFSPKEHSSTPHPIVWVPVGDADRHFLESIAKISEGMFVEGARIRSLCGYLRIQELIGKIYICVNGKHGQFDVEETRAILGALAGDMTPDHKAQVLEGVKQKVETKQDRNPDSEPNDYDNVNEVPELPPLGSRVVRGPGWRYGDQDAEGPGTIINHSSEDKLLWVLWDFSTSVCRYRFGRDGKYDVTTVEDHPRTLMSDELIEIGVKVKRGPDWTYGDIDGGPGGMGVVIRRRQDGKVKVRWQTGEIKSCKFGYDGKFDLQICNEGDTARTSPPTASLSATRPAGVEVSSEKPHLLWQWKDTMGQWRLYKRGDIDKLNMESARRPTGSCHLNIHGKNRRVLFKSMTEIEIDTDVKREVKKIAVDDQERDELICMEMTVDEHYNWTK